MLANNTKPIWQRDKKRVTKKKTPKHLEYDLQVECVNWFHRYFKNYVLYSVPVEGCVNQMTKFKKSGLLPGVADLVVLFPGGRSVYIEMKSPEGRQRQAQSVFERKIMNLGFDYYICRSLEQFKEIIHKYTMK